MITKRFIVVAFGIALVGVIIYLLTQASDKARNNQEINNPVATSSTSNSSILNSKEKMDKVESEEVVYFENVKGFLSRPKVSGNYPGVVMIHEWWGLNDQIKSMAQSLASEGYVVLAVDLYNGKVATTQDEARAQTSSLDQNKALENLKAATSYLKNNQKTTKVASLGWCFGGGQSLQLALNDGPLDATVIYYGNLTDDQSKLKNIKWPVLGIFGDKDQSISVDSVKKFQTALNNLEVKNEIHIYPGVGHAFANPTGQNYAPTETKDAWEKTLKFLNENLKK